MAAPPTPSCCCSANDTSARLAARALLRTDADAYGSWPAGASRGRVQASDAAAGVRMHVEELMGQADAYAAGDYQQADRIERQFDLWVVGSQFSRLVDTGRGG